MASARPRLRGKRTSVVGIVPPAMKAAITSSWSCADRTVDDQHELIRQHRLSLDACGAKSARFEAVFRIDTWTSER